MNAVTNPSGPWLGPSMVRTPSWDPPESTAMGPFTAGLPLRSDPKRAKNCEGALHVEPVLVKCVKSAMYGVDGLTPAIDAKAMPALQSSADDQGIPPEGNPD